MQNANSGSILTKVLISLVAAGAVALLVGRWVATREAHLVISEPAKAVDIAAMQAEAERGEATAQFNLGSLNAKGLTVTQSYTLAAKWYRLAADQGDALAQFNLGMRYYEGRGIAAEPVQAYQWLSLAAAQGITDAAQARDALKGTMTRDQLAEGQRRASTFTPKKISAKTP